MPGSTKSLVKATGSVKPMNIFYIWYVELCRRANTNPLTTVKSTKLKSEHILDFTADRIKSEEWTPIINALRLDTSLHVIAIRSRITGCKFLHEINTEEKVRRLPRQSGALWTDYVLRSLMRSVGSCLLNSIVLSGLELEGIPLFREYFDMLLETLKKNKTIKSLSLRRCPIGDVGCFQLCSCLNSMVNIEFLNLSGCQLSAVSGQYIAKVIKSQQINRYCESWQKSLRYVEPDAGLMAGLKRITLNNNPDIGDEGLCYILNELDDDLWIKAIDMQKCSITENMARRIIDVVEYSRSLEVADFRNNSLTFTTMQQILEFLNKKQPLGIDSMYPWCTTTSTLQEFTFGTPRSNFTDKFSMVQKSKSAPLGHMDLIPKYGQHHTLRRTRTLGVVEEKTKLDFNHPEVKELSDAKKKLVALHDKLQHEMVKRRETEKLNAKLQQKLDNINKIGQANIKSKYSNASQIIKNIRLNSKDHISTIPKEKHFAKKEINQKKIIKKIKPKSAKQKFIPKNSDKGALKQEKPKNVDKKSIAQNLFEQFIKVEPKNDGYKNKQDLSNLLTYVCSGDSKTDVPEELKSSSCSSLEHFLQEISLDSDSKLEKKSPTSSPDKKTKGIVLSKKPQDINVKSQFKKHIGRVR